MHLKTKGIVLTNMKYNDKYSIATIYTEQSGRMAYIVSKSKGKSSKIPYNLFSPLNIIELEVEHQPSREIQRIKEARNIFPFHSISQNMSKTSIVFFLSEFLSKVLKDSNDSMLIYHFISDSMQVLEMTERGVANFHLVFMLRLTKFLGFYPNMEDYQEGKLFDLLAGEFVSATPFHRHYISKGESLALSRLARITYANMHRFGFGRDDRASIIRHIVEYYRLHLENFSELKSLDVLHELF
jgi:DNA repair protein RecO (recombination protein O)